MFIRFIVVCFVDSFQVSPSFSEKNQINNSLKLLTRIKLSVIYFTNHKHFKFFLLLCRLKSISRWPAQTWKSTPTQGTQIRFSAGALPTVDNTRLWAGRRLFHSHVSAYFLSLFTFTNHFQVGLSMDAFYASSLTSSSFFRFFNYTLASPVRLMSSCSFLVNCVDLSRVIDYQHSVSWGQHHHQQQ